MTSFAHWQWHSGLQYLSIQKLNYEKYSWQFTWLAMCSSVRKKNHVDFPVKGSGSSTSLASTLNRLHLLNMTKCGWIDGLTCLQLNLTFKFICTSMQLRWDSTAVTVAFVNGWWQKVVYANVIRGKSGTNAYGSWKYCGLAGRAMTAWTRISLYFVIVTSNLASLQTDHGQQSTVLQMQQFATTMHVLREPDRLHVFRKIWSAGNSGQ